MFGEVVRDPRVKCPQVRPAGLVAGTGDADEFEGPTVLAADQSPGNSTPDIRREAAGHSVPGDCYGRADKGRVVRWAKGCLQFWCDAGSITGKLS